MATIVLQDGTYPSVEHAFHAGKAPLMGDTQEASKFTVTGEYADLIPFKIKRERRCDRDLESRGVAQAHGGGDPCAIQDGRLLQGRAQTHGRCAARPPDALRDTS